MIRAPFRTTLALTAAAALLGACGTTGPVGPTPGASVAYGPESPTPTYDGLKIDISVDAQTVTPVDRTFEVRRGTSVVLVIRSSQDATVKAKGPGVDESVFVARLTTITSTFVAAQPGTVTITTDDPRATIATLTVT